MLNTYRVVPFDSKYGTIGPNHNGTTVHSLFQPIGDASAGIDGAAAR